MDIDLRLAARRDALQQRHPLLQEREEYLVVGILLRLTQRLDTLWMRLAAMIQASHLHFIGLEEATFHQLVDDGETTLRHV